MKSIYNVNFDSEYKRINEEINTIDEKKKLLEKEIDKIKPNINIITSLRSYIQSDNFDYKEFMNKYIKCIVIGSYLDNNRADCYHIRFIYKNEIDVFISITPSIIKNLKTNRIIDFYFKYRLFYYTSKRNKRNINRVRVSLEIEEGI